jgi:hypothetical protein
MVMFALIVFAYLVSEVMEAFSPNRHLEEG